MMALFMHSIVMDTNTEDAMHAGVCPQEWLTVCQELYCAAWHWVADHPDAAPAEIERILTAACTYLRVRLTDDLARQHVGGDAVPDGAQAAAPALIRLAPAIWRCQGVDHLVRITGIAGYSHDGHVLYLTDAQSRTGIPLHEIVRYVDDPADSSASRVPAALPPASSPVGPPAPTLRVTAPDATDGRMLALVASLLFPATTPVRVERLTIDADTIILTLTATQTVGCCPTCGMPSQRCHGSYLRTLADCSWAERPVVLQVRVRRFVCASTTCSRRTFPASLPDLMPRSARRTLRLTTRLRQIGTALGGRAGARLAHAQARPTSPTTVLRLVQAGVSPPARAPRVLGLDDWAFKKGQTYGTILVDLEARRPIDLLPDRSADSVATWLQTHPGAEIICRDRAPAYADGVTRGAPQAIQVADRFHLLQNMREALQRLCERQQPALRAASTPPGADTATPAPGDSVPPAPPAGEPPGDAPVPAVVPPVAPDSAAAIPPDGAPPDDAPVPGVVRSASPDSAAAIPDPGSGRMTNSAQLRQARRAQRYARYAEVHTLHAQGLGKRAIARQLGISRATVRSFLAAATFPERATRTTAASTLDPYKPYLQEQVRAGVQNARQLWEAICAQGYAGSASRVRQYVGTLRVGRMGRGSRESTPPPDPGTTDRAATVVPPAPRPRRVSARQAAWLLVCPAPQRTAVQQAQVDRLLEASPELARAHTLAQDFGTLIRKRQRAQLDPWLAAALDSKLEEVSSFARGLQQTYAEVAAALELSWSNGQVEGQVNRLKTIKRQLYGRAKFALLRAMVLAPG